MAKEVTNKKSVTTTIDMGLYDFLEDIRWSERKNMAELLRDTLTSGAVELGYVPPVES